jgi:hypothetical protein
VSRYNVAVLRRSLVVMLAVQWSATGIIGVTLGVMSTIESTPYWALSLGQAIFLSALMLVFVTSAFAVVILRRLRHYR